MPEKKLAPAVVWNSLRLLAYLYATGVAVSSSFEELVAEYEQEVKHTFSRREVVRVAKEFGILRA